MARYNVEHKGYWACYSSICDAFITDFNDLKSYKEWYVIEYGRHGARTFDTDNKMDFQEAISDIGEYEEEQEKYIKKFLKDLADNNMEKEREERKKLAKLAGMIVLADELKK